MLMLSEGEALNCVGSAPFRHPRLLCLDRGRASVSVGGARGMLIWGRRKLALGGTWRLEGVAGGCKGCWEDVLPS